MSRHRMVRNLTQDDYYDDYDDDYYDDEDYDEDDNYYAPPPRTNTAGSNSLPAQHQNKLHNTSTNTIATTAKIAVSGKSATSASVGVTKPPPGWGKPSPPTASAAATPGVAKPPPGWGRPSTPSVGNVAGQESSQNTSSAGISRPPPGWGKPAPPQANTVSMAGTTSTTEALPSKNEPKSQKLSIEKKIGKKIGNSDMSTPFTPKTIPSCLETSNSDSKSQLTMVVLGHVDAGKSTLMGQLLIQTGKVAKREVHKYQGNISWILDENESERAHGVTMEIGTKSMVTPSHDIVLLDAPGHADFIPVMITGAANADTAVLVVAAVTGEFEAGFVGGGQTKEHILLAKGLGVSQVIVAINKLDVEGWDEDRYKVIESQIKKYLLQQQFKAPRIRFVPLSGLTGENVKARTDARLKSWYKGPTLLEAIDNFKPANRHLGKPFRFIVTDMYAEGRGVVARGRVVQGFLRVGGKAVVLPIGDATTVSKIEHIQPPSSTDPERLTIAAAGDTTELLLTGIDPMRISVGNILVEPSGRPPILKKARAKLVVMDDLKIPIIRGAQVLFHMHSLDIPAVLTKLVALTKRDGSIHRERPRALTSGSGAIVEISLSDRVVMERFQDCRALGRFVLRRGGDTLAVGIIDEVIP